MLITFPFSSPPFQPQLTNLQQRAKFLPVEKMATNITRLLGNNRALGHGQAYLFNSKTRAMESTSFSVLSKMGFQGEKTAVAGEGEKKPPMALKASVALADRTSTSKTQTSEEVKLAFILANVSSLVFHGLKAITYKPRPWRSHIQTLIERVCQSSQTFFPSHEREFWSFLF